MGECTTGVPYQGICPSDGKPHARATWDISFGGNSTDSLSGICGPEVALFNPNGGWGNHFSSVENRCNRVIWFGRGYFTQTGNTIADYLNYFSTDSIYAVFPTQINSNLTTTPFNDTFCCWIIDNLACTFERFVSAFYIQNGVTDYNYVRNYTSWLFDISSIGFQIRQNILQNITCSGSPTFKAYDVCLFLAAIYNRPEWNDVQTYFYRNCTSVQKLPPCLLIDLAYYTSNLDSTLNLSSDYSNMQDLTFTTNPLVTRDAAQRIISQFLVDYYKNSSYDSKDPFLSIIFGIPTSSTSNLSKFYATSGWLNSYCQGNNWVQDGNSTTGWCLNWLTELNVDNGRTNATAFCGTDDNNAVNYPILCGCLMPSSYYDNLKQKITQQFPQLGQIADFIPWCQFENCVTSPLSQVLHPGYICPNQQLCFQNMTINSQGNVSIGQINQNVSCSQQIDNGNTSTNTNTNTDTNTTNTSTKNNTSNLFNQTNLLIAGAAAVMIVIILIIFIINDN